MKSRTDIVPGWKMTFGQKDSYFSMWQSIVRKHGWNAAEAEEQRLLAHERALGDRRSRKDIDHLNDFTKIKAEFMALLKPGDINPQLRQLDMPHRNLRWKVMNVQTSLLAVVLPPAADATDLDRQLAAENYIATVMRDKFHTTDLKEVNERRPHPDAYSDLEKLVFTIEARINTLRNERGYTVHQMNQLAGIPCVDSCRKCRMFRSLEKVVQHQPEVAA